MKIIHMEIPKDFSRRSGLALRPEGVTIHSTGNQKSTARNEAENVCNNDTRIASWHFVVGDNVIYQVLPLDEVAWHAGDGRNGTGNRTTIAIEMVETGDRKKVIENTVGLVRDLMKQYGFGPDKVYKHNHWTGKNCPRILIDSAYIKDGVTWVYFMNRLKEDEPMEKVYNSLEELPSYWKPMVKWAKEKGIFSGQKNGAFALTETQVKALVFLYNDNKRKGTL